MVAWKRFDARRVRPRVTQYGTAVRRTREGCIRTDDAYWRYLEISETDVLFVFSKNYLKESTK